MLNAEQMPLFSKRYRFRHDGKPCPVRGCDALAGVLWMAHSGQRLVGDTEGPQGSWRCAGGHSGWFFPKDCTQEGRR